MVFVSCALDGGGAGARCHDGLSLWTLHACSSVCSSIRRTPDYGRHDGRVRRHHGFSRRGKLAFIAGGALCGLLQAAYNYHCFGSPFNMAYANLALPEFNEEAASGVFGVHLPQFSVLIRLLFSPARGLFFSSPVLLLVLDGFYRMAGNPARRVPAVDISDCFCAFRPDVVAGNDDGFWCADWAGSNGHSLYS